MDEGSAGYGGAKTLTIQDLNLEEVEIFSDGSRLDVATAAASSGHAEYLWMHATVMEAEMLGVLLALEDGACRVTLDSQVAIKRL